MDELGLLEKVEDHTHNVTISDRSKTAIEPLVSEQWFVAMEKLAEPAIAAAKGESERTVVEESEEAFLKFVTADHTIRGNINDLLERKNKIRKNNFSKIHSKIKCFFIC